MSDPGDDQVAMQSDRDDEAAQATDPDALLLLDNRDTDDSDEDMNTADAEDHPKRNKIVLTIAALLGVLALVVVAWFVGLLAGGVFGPATPKQSASSDSSASSAPKKSSSSAAPSATGQPIAVAGATLLDPPPGDGQENPNRINLSYDGNPATTWPTLQYQGSATFGNIKKGVGIVYDLGFPSTVASVTIQTTIPGAVVQIRTGTAATGSSIDAYPQVGADTTLTGDSTTITLPPGTKTQYIVVWITQLVQQSNGSYQAALSEVSFKS